MNAAEVDDACCDQHREGIRALVIPADPDRPMREVVLVDREIGYARELRDLVGAGPVGRTTAPDGSAVWHDDHYMLRSPAPEVNDRATTLVARVDGWIIRGDVVVTGPIDPDGDPTALSPDRARLLREVLG